MRWTSITIVRKRIPSDKTVNEELQWLGHSLGLFSIRDKDKSCFRVFIILVKNLKAKQGSTSDEIADLTNLTRGTVVHHLKKLMSAGLVVLDNNKYYLSVENLEELVDLVESNLLKTTGQLRNVAKNIDHRLRI